MEQNIAGDISKTISGIVYSLTMSISIPEIRNFSKL